MTRRDALRALERAVGSGQAEPRHFNAVWNQFGPEWPIGHNAALADEGSLDAAKALHEALLPGFRAKIEKGGADAYNMARPVDIWTVSLWAKDPMSIMAMFGPMGQDKDPASAWLLAIIRALIAQEGGE